MSSKKLDTAINDVDSLHAYLRAIARIPRLTVEEERELGDTLVQETKCPSSRS